jgi:D-beta-D-heptose 7-phosphate kinase/D-beta-D-heptose 1-phosphate adenosyltransferase
MQKKLLKLDELIKKISNHKSSNKKIGLITGCFDVLHAGHIHFIQQARKQSDVLIIGLENDFNIKRSKGLDRPIHNFDQRSLVLSELKSVTYIFKIESEFEQFDERAENYYDSLLQTLKPDYLFSNSETDKHIEQKIKKSTSNNLKLILIDRQHDTSSSAIIKKLS